MNASKIGEKIIFKKQLVDDERTLLVASLELSRGTVVRSSLLKREPDAEVEIKKRLREELLGDIYEDQRQELYGALMELFKARPFDFQELQKAREKVLEAVMRQQPKGKTDHPPWMGQFK